MSRPLHRRARLQGHGHHSLSIRRDDGQVLAPRFSVDVSWPAGHMQFGADRRDVEEWVRLLQGLLVEPEPVVVEGLDE